MKHPTRAFKFLPYILLILLLPTVTYAFDDDSTDDTRSLLEIRTICENGKTIINTDIHRSSCQGDDVYLNQLRTKLIKNGTVITSEKILDFKIARNGNLYYRTKFEPYLYNEEGQLNSNGGIVTLFLVSSNGDVVYLNDRGDVFKNGAQLKRGAAKVPVTFVEIGFLGERISLVENPIVSRNGKAVYINDSGHLYVDGNRINSKVGNVVALRLNSEGDVYYIDDNNRLYRNTEKLFDGRFRILEFQLSNEGQVAYLTDAISNNLYLEDKVLPAGSQEVINFNFNSSGEVIYEDKLGRLWKDGQQIGR
jgi:hypothetical protein